MENLLLGIPLRSGDEILTTDQDYPRMLTTIRQRVRRDAVRLRTFPVPAPAPSQDVLFERFSEQNSPRTRIILVSHVGHMTGHIYPVRRICDLARRRGITCLVDGAHAFAQIRFRRDDLGCETYGVSLHKWLGAPFGTGMLYVRRRLIPRLWPLMAATKKQDSDIRKFEEIGTSPLALRTAIGDAIDFHRMIGPARKENRLRWLRDRWARRLARHPRVRLRTNLDPGMSCALGTFAIDGIDSKKLADWLWRRHRILVSWIDHPRIHGIRITANVYTAPAEIDRFCDIVERALRNGLR